MTSDVLARAQLLLDAGRPKDAVAVLAPELASDPQAPPILDLMACAQLEFDPRAALSTSEQLIGAAPYGHRGYVLSAQALRLLGHKRKAVKRVRKAVELAPNDVFTQVSVAEVVTYKGGNYREGRRAAECAMALAPNDPAGLLARGAVELQTGRGAKAMAMYERALAVDPTNATAQKNLAIAAGLAGELDRAFANTQAVLRFDPQDAEARQAFDRVVYTTVVHLVWVAAFALYIVSRWRGLSPCRCTARSRESRRLRSCSATSR